MKIIISKIFNKDFNFRIIWGIILPVIFLCAFGLILLRSISFDCIDCETNYITFYNQSTWMLIGIGIFIFMQFIRLKVFNEYAYHLYVLLNLGLLITYFMPEKDGASRWIDFGFFSFQPSEVGKILVIFTIAKFLADRKDNKKEFLTIIITLAISLFPAVLVFGQPDLGTAIIYLSVIFPMLYWSGIKSYYLFLFIAPIISMISSYSIFTFYIWMFIVVIILFYNQPTIRQASIIFITNICFGLISIVVYENYLFDHQRKRLEIMLDPFKDPNGAGYQVIQSMVSVGSGGILGKGFKQGTQNSLHYLPVRDTDFIVSVAGEEFGLLGISFILLLFSIFIYWITQYLNKMNNDFSSLTLIGILTVLFVHLVVNMGMTVGLFPVTGLPAPFLSYGGTFLLTCLTMVAIVNNNITNNI